MNTLNIKFDSAKLDELKALRNKYLNKITEAQEHYLEFKIKSSDSIKIVYDEKTIGYAIIENNETLLEYFIEKEFINETETIFNFLMEVKELQFVICKSFDQQLLALCLQNKYKGNVIGLLFRETQQEKLPYTGDLSIRGAENSDVASIMEINENVFIDKSDLNYNIQAKSVLIFEKFDELIGVGIFSPIIEDRPATDIGVLINRQFRNRGYGTQIIRYLHNLCVDNEMKPQCGCAFSNNSSRRAIEKAGYFATYRMIEFVV